MGVFASRKPVRSTTMPCRSHDPSTDRIDQVLNKVKTWESSVSLLNPSADIVCRGLSEITGLYACFDEFVKASLLHISSSSSNQNHKRYTDLLLEISGTFLDICSNASDVLSQTKQNLRDLECDLRRNNAGECIVAKYIFLRNKLKKDVKRSLASLKKLDNMICGSPLIEQDSDNNIRLSSVIRVFREVNATSTVIFRLLQVFLATPLMKKVRPTGRRSVVSRFISNGKVVPEEQASACKNDNEFHCLDAAFLTYIGCKRQEVLQSVQIKLQTMETCLEGINSHLELISRRQIAARSSLLNMVSLY